MAESSTTGTWVATQSAASLLTTALVAAALLSGCTGRAGQPPAVGTTSATLTSTQSVPPRSAAEQERAAQAVVDFWTELDRLALEPERPMTELSNVASGQAWAKWHELTRNMRGSGVTQIGTVSVREPSPHYDSTTETYAVEACIDVSAVDVRNRNGISIIGKDRPSRTRFTYVVAKVGEAFVVTDDSSAGEPC